MSRAGSPTGAPLVVIVTTHTTRHLRRTLMGVAFQSRRTDRIVVSCDNDSEAIRELVRGAAAEFSAGITLVRRAFAGTSRSGQVRNNGVRAVEADGLSPATRLVFLDGDCCPAPTALELHERLGAGGRMVVGFRIDLSEEQTAAFSETAIRDGRSPVEPNSEQLGALRSRQRRYERQWMLHRLGLGKSHKPKLLSANFSIPLGVYQELNGFDEAYEGYGQEDDDLGRRYYRSGGRPVIAVAGLPVLHLYHPTRAPGEWHQSPNAALFKTGQRGPVRCELGLDNPARQEGVGVERFAAGSTRAAMSHQ